LDFVFSGRLDLKLIDLVAKGHHVNISATILAQANWAQGHLVCSSRKVLNKDICAQAYTGRIEEADLGESVDRRLAPRESLCSAGQAKKTTTKRRRRYSHASIYIRSF